MGFRYYRRIKLGKGLGVNISKSGLSTSYRSKKGSINSKGFSVRTGISGLSYRKSFKNSGCLLSVFMLFMSIILLTSCSDTFNDDREDLNEVGCIDTNCADYTSQSAAQAAYNTDPECRGDLDADNDGIACEEPGNSVTTCANTSNCGCSNKPMSQCENDPCCRWIVGEGCQCR